MMRPYWTGEASRHIVKRIVVEGALILLTSAHFGNGDSDELTDMSLLVDPRDGKTPLLTGTSLAGALRSYLRERQQGYGYALDLNDVNQAALKAAAVALFGGLKQDDEGEQSPLIVDDAYGNHCGMERRNGVALNAASRTAADKTKFDAQLWQAGTQFGLRFELAVRGGDHPDDEAWLRQALVTALDGLSDGSITLGARKRRGYGRVEVRQWRVREFDLKTKQGLRDWLLEGDKALMGAAIPHAQLPAVLGASLLPDARHYFEMQAVFTLDGSLLIRSGGQGQEPDMVHLHASRATGTDGANSKCDPVLSGTSLGGALRARACKIARTLDPDASHASADKIVAAIFGQTSQASRLEIWEQAIESGTMHLVQNRVSIDRFTGGAREGALFNQQPVFGNSATRVRVTCRLRIPHDDPTANAEEKAQARAQTAAEIGLLLHLLKDLWTGDLPLGGESSVGRGRLKGQCADLTLQRDGAQHTWKLEATDARLATNGKVTQSNIVTDQTSAQVHAALEDFAAAFQQQMRPAKRE